MSEKRTTKHFRGFTLGLAACAVAISMLQHRSCKYSFRFVAIDIDCTAEQEQSDAEAVSKERRARLWGEVHARRTMASYRDATQKLAVQAAQGQELQRRVMELGIENTALRDKVSAEEAYSRRLVQNLSDEATRRIALEAQTKADWERLVVAGFHGERLKACEAEVQALKSKGLGLGLNGPSALVR